MGYILGLYWDNGKDYGSYCLGFKGSILPGPFKKMKIPDYCIQGPFCYSFWVLLKNLAEVRGLSVK